MILICLIIIIYIQMGCGSSVNQLEVVAVPETKQEIGPAPSKDNPQNKDIQENKEK